MPSPPLSTDRHRPITDLSSGCTMTTTPTSTTTTEETVSQMWSVQDSLVQRTAERERATTRHVRTAWSAASMASCHHHHTLTGHHQLTVSRYDMTTKRILLWILLWILLYINWCAALAAQSMRLPIEWEFFVWGGCNSSKTMTCVCVKSKKWDN